MAETVVAAQIVVGASATYGVPVCAFVLARCMRGESPAMPSEGAAT